ncbi:hypothetical protein [Mycetocola zhadangensis]|uniref:hypothetical protein n=1 Tax=Mycetocola zhadangensis TaxID=1164595 RepID=UPI0016009B04|nr:hypothetical protein [Mycetocola zhadangensis]
MSAHRFTMQLDVSGPFKKLAAVERPQPPAESIGRQQAHPLWGKRTAATRARV